MITNLSFQLLNLLVLLTSQIKDCCLLVQNLSRYSIGNPLYVNFNPRNIYYLLNSKVPEYASISFTGENIDKL